MADKYVLRITAGSDYDVDTHIVVPINTPEPVKISSQLMDAELNVRVQNYRGLPRYSPKTSPYFSIPIHEKNKDQYSISFRFTPKRPSIMPSSASSRSSSTSRASKSSIRSKFSIKSKLSSKSKEVNATPGIQGISATNLQFGNNFDHPIRDRLPPGFGTAMNIVKWFVDPGLEGDPYADQPYLYGPALSSFNVVHVGMGEYDAEKGGLVFDEGGNEAGLEARKAVGAPVTSKERIKWALRKDSKEKWMFEYDQTYGFDFFNPYLDFAEFCLRLPGFTLPIMKYWDGQGLRYVLRNNSTDDVYMVILFTLYLVEDVNEDGSLKPAAIEAQALGSTCDIKKGRLVSQDVLENPETDKVVERECNNIDKAELKGVEVDHDDDVD